MLVSPANIINIDLFLVSNCNQDNANKKKIHTHTMVIPYRRITYEKILY